MLLLSRPQLDRKKIEVAPPLLTNLWLAPTEEGWSEDDLGFAPAMEQTLRYGRGKARKLGILWIVISLAAHATALACCAHWIPPVISLSRAIAERESVPLGTSTAMLGEGFDWSRVPSFQSSAKQQIWNIEPLSLPAPTALPTVASQEPPVPPAAVVLPKLQPVSPPVKPDPVAAMPLPKHKKAAKIQLVSSESTPAKAASQPVAHSDGKNLKTAVSATGKVGWYQGKSGSSVGSGSGLPQLIYNPPPEYPPDALAAGLTGRVLLRVAVRPDGTVQSAKLFRTSGVDMLDEAALKIINSWRFAPRDLSGDAWEVVVPINFAIEEQ